MWGGHDDTTLYVHVCMGLPPFFSFLPWDGCTLPPAPKRRQPLNMNTNRHTHTHVQKNKFKRKEKNKRKRELYYIAVGFFFFYYFFSSSFRYILLDTYIRRLHSSTFTPGKVLNFFLFFNDNKKKNCRPTITNWCQKIHPVEINFWKWNNSFHLRNKIKKKKYSIK